MINSTSAPATDATLHRDSPDAAPALEVRQVSLSFPQGKTRLSVLNDISLTVGKGEFVSLIGPSGCGKSTLFHAIGGLITPDQGNLQMNGHDVTGQKGHISYMPQQPALFPWRTIEQNILLSRELKGTIHKEEQVLAAEWMRRAGLSEFSGSYPYMLSGGMQQRAAFVRAMMSPEELICLDEPFSALDAITRSDMQRWLLDLWEEHRRSVLLITHSIEEALLLSSRIYVLSSRPASVLHVIDVPFPRPRREEITDDPAFLKLKRELSMCLQQEHHHMQKGR